MPVHPEHVTTLSQLLDAALALRPAQRAAWLAALPREYAGYAPYLNQMLSASEAQVERSSTLPALDDFAHVDEALHAGKAVGPYRLVREIGRGGMGSVWLADRVDAGLNRRVALKLPRLSWVAGMARRMARERDIGARLEHANIARLYDAGVDARGWPYLAFEYVDGVPIDRWCARQTTSIRDRVELIIRVAAAVAYAHARQVIHRDLKPSNVLVTADGVVHLLDFGIARLLDDDARDDDATRTHGRAMTLPYAAPELILGDDATTASDIYSLGALAYELLARAKPFVPARDTAAALEEAILRGDAPPASSRASPDDAPHLQGGLDAIVEVAMRVEPGERYDSVEALVDDLRQYLEGRPVHAEAHARGRGPGHRTSTQSGALRPNSGQALRFLHLDDHALFCDGLALVVAAIVPHARVQQVHSLADACAALRHTPPDIVLTDLHLPGCNGAEVVRALRAVNDTVPLAVVSASEDPHVMRACIQAGAMAFVRKSAGMHEMRDAISRIAAGGVWLPPGAVAGDGCAASHMRHARLSRRQCDILTALVQGKPHKVIARELEMPASAIELQVTAVLDELGVADRAQAVYRVAHHGMPVPDAADESAACEA
jgi:serine/threonine protein kinase/DNA-binding NarL/FixJ family response regulator